MWCWRRLLRVPWTARRCNQSILREISPEYSLEGDWTKLYCSMPGFPVCHELQSLLKFMSIESVIPSNHFILCCPLFLLLSIFPSIKHYPSLGLKWKLIFSTPVATAEFSKFAGILSAVLSQHHLFGFEIAQKICCLEVLSFKIPWSVTSYPQRLAVETRKQQTSGANGHNFVWRVNSVQSISFVWLFATPWTAACQASLSITNFQSL